MNPGTHVGSMRSRTAVVTVLLVALPVAGCIGTGGDAGARLDGWSLLDDTAAVYALNRTVGPPTHDHLQIADSLLAVHDGTHVRWASTGFGPGLLDLASMDAFPNPLLSPLDPRTGNPVVDGRVVPLLSPPDGASSWTADWSGVTWDLRTVEADGAEGTRIEGTTETGANLVVAYDEAPWRPTRIRYTNASGVVGLDVRLRGTKPVDDGARRSLFDLVPLASFIGSVDTLRRNAGDTYDLRAPGDRTYLFLNARCGPERDTLPAAGSVSLRIDQDGTRRADETCSNPDQRRSCLANAGVAFSPGPVEVALSHDAGGLAEMEARAVVYRIDEQVLRVDDGRAVPAGADREVDLADRVSCFWERTAHLDVGGSVPFGLDRAADRRLPR